MDSEERVNEWLGIIIYETLDFLGAVAVVLVVEVIARKAIEAARGKHKGD